MNSNSSLLSRLEHHAENTPNRVALTGSEYSLNYAELQQAVAETADQLCATGSLVTATLLDNGIDWIVLDLALMSAGITHVPVPTFFSHSQVEHLLDKTAADSLITDRVQRQMLGHLMEKGRFVRSSRFGQLAHMTCRKVTEIPELDNVAKITFTSGTTGQPKGVCISSRSLNSVAFELQQAVNCVQPERHLCVTPLTTLLENIAGVYASLSEGIQVLVPPLAKIGFQEDLTFNPMHFAEAVISRKPDTLIVVPQLLNVLVTMAEQGINLDHLKFIAAGGARISQNLMNRAQAVQLPVYQGYGLSECTSVVALNRPGMNRLGSVGKPLSLWEVRIGEDSEIEVLGAHRSHYLGESARDDWMATGDLGYLDSDGYLYITGRKRNVFINSLGRNVNPEWPESELNQQAPIRAALVTGEAKSFNHALIWVRDRNTSDEVIDAAVRTANATLPAYAQVSSWRRMDEIDPDLISKDGRIRRELALHRFHNLIEEDYGHNRSCAIL